MLKKNKEKKLTRKVTVPERNKSKREMSAEKLADLILKGDKEALTKGLQVMMMANRQIYEFNNNANPQPIDLLLLSNEFEPGHVTENTTVQQLADAISNIMAEAASGYMYISSPAETVITVQNQYEKIAGTYTAPAGLLNDFTHLDGDLTYTGAEPISLLVVPRMTVAANLVANITATAAVFKNGVLEPGSEMPAFLGPTTDTPYPTVPVVLIEMVQGDTINLRIANNSSLDNLTVTTLGCPAITGGVPAAGNNVVISWNASTDPVDVTAGDNISIVGGVISATGVENVVATWDGLTTPVNVVAGTEMSITGGVISTTAEKNVVSLWNGSAAPVNIIAGDNISIAGGIISATGTENVVASWDGSTIPVNVTAGSFIDITNGSISTTAQPNVITQWDGSASPLAITAGSNIDITAGVISFTGSIPGGQDMQSTYATGVNSEITLDAGTGRPFTIRDNLGNRYFQQLDKSTLFNTDFSPGLFNINSQGVSGALNVDYDTNLMSFGITPFTTGLQQMGGTKFVVTQPISNYPAGVEKTMWTLAQGTTNVQSFSFPVGSTLEFDFAGAAELFTDVAALITPSYFRVKFGNIINLQSDNINPATFPNFNGNFNFKVKITRLNGIQLAFSGSGSYKGPSGDYKFFDFPHNVVNTYDESLAYSLDVTFENGIGGGGSNQLFFIAYNAECRQINSYDPFPMLKMLSNKKMTDSQAIVRGRNFGISKDKVLEIRKSKKLEEVEL